MVFWSTIQMPLLSVWYQIAQRITYIGNNYSYKKKCTQTISTNTKKDVTKDAQLIIVHFIIQIMLFYMLDPMA